MTPTPCPHCHATGTVTAYACPGFRAVQMACRSCGGSGQVTADWIEQTERAAAVRHERVARHIPIREMAAHLGLTPSAYSGMERGEAPFPADFSWPLSVSPAG